MKVFLSALVLIAAPVVFPEILAAQCDPGAGQAAFFVDIQYRGGCVVRGIGDYPTAASIGLPNDSISSIRLGVGAQVVACRDVNYGGHCQLYTTHVADMRSTGVGNDMISSAKVQAAPNAQSCRPGRGQVAFFMHDNFVPPCSLRSLGDYSNPAALGLPNDSISSILVGPGAHAFVCVDIDFGGYCQSFAANEAHLGGTPIGNDRISSARVQMYVGDANDPATILADADAFYRTYFGNSDDEEAAEIKASFDKSNVPPYCDPSKTPPYWDKGRRTSALVQMYDLIAPLDPERAGRYLERLRRIADALLANRDDKRNFPADSFRARVMPAWGAFTQNRDCKWNTDVVTAGVFTYAMAAFARRVADTPALHVLYGADAIRFTSAVFDTYTAFRPEMHLTEDDPQAYFTQPAAYAGLRCGVNPACDVSRAAVGELAYAFLCSPEHYCAVYRATAGKPLAYNENLSMMKALAEAALAGASPLYLQSADSNPSRTHLATYEAPLLIAKNFTFFDRHLRPKTLSDGTPYFEWDHQQPTSSIQDTAHAGFELGSLAVLLDNKIRLNALLAAAGRSEQVALSTPLFVRFANTFLRKIWHYDYSNANGLGNVLDKKVDGTSNPTETNNANEECAGWIPLAQFDRWVWTRCRDATFRHAKYPREDNIAALLRYRQFH